MKPWGKLFNSFYLLPSLEALVGCGGGGGRGRGGGADVKAALATVAAERAKHTVIVDSIFQFTEDSNDVSDLVADFITANIAPTEVLTAEDLVDIAGGDTTFVQSVGDVNEARTSIEKFAEGNLDLIEGPVGELIESLPSAKWDQSTWNNLNWG